METDVPPLLAHYAELAYQLLLQPQTYWQLTLVAGIYLLA